jgi:hypothetical protein
MHCGTNFRRSVLTLEDMAKLRSSVGFTMLLKDKFTFAAAEQSKDEDEADDSATLPAPRRAPGSAKKRAPVEADDEPAHEDEQEEDPRQNEEEEKKEDKGEQTVGKKRGLSSALAKQTSSSTHLVEK